MRPRRWAVSLMVLICVPKVLGLPTGLAHVLELIEPVSRVVLTCVAGLVRGVVVPLFGSLDAIVESGGLGDQGRRTGNKGPRWLVVRQV